MSWHKWGKMVKNDRKLKLSGKWKKNGAACGVVIAWSSFLFTDIIATAPSDNIFVNKGGDRVKRLPISRHKKGKMAKN